jgi:hypothetical protein
MMSQSFLLKDSSVDKSRRLVEEGRDLRSLEFT